MRNSKREGSRWAILCIVIAGLCCLGQAQPDRRWELGAQWVVADFEGLGEVPGGFGVRCLYNLNDYLALDGEVDYFPDRSRGGASRLPSPLPGLRAGVTWPHGETEALAGLRAGFRFGNAGIFARVRPGIIRLTDHQTRWLTDSAKTRGALDLGGTFEYSPASRLVIRFDLGKVFIPLGDRFVSAVDPLPITPVASWNLHGGIGFAIRL